MYNSWSKKTKIWLWLAVCSLTRKILGYELGSRGTLTLQRLLDKLKADVYCTDGYRSYQELIPPSQHIIGKRHTFNIESVNSLFRRYLARFHRRTVCFSRSKYDLQLAIKLLVHNLNLN